MAAAATCPLNPAASSGLNLSSMHMEGLFMIKIHTSSSWRWNVKQMQADSCSCKQAGIQCTAVCSPKKDGLQPCTDRADAARRLCLRAVSSAMLDTSH